MLEALFFEEAKPVRDIVTTSKYIRFAAEHAACRKPLTTESSFLRISGIPLRKVRHLPLCHSVLVANMRRQAGKNRRMEGGISCGSRCRGKQVSKGKKKEREKSLYGYLGVAPEVTNITRQEE